MRASPSMALALALAALAPVLGALAFASSRRWDRAVAAPTALHPDLNAAPERHLLLLPGIGPTRARAIVLDRERIGPFAVVGDLPRVKGIGPLTAAALAPLVRSSPREGATGDAP